MLYLVLLIMYNCSEIYVPNTRIGAIWSEEQAGVPLYFAHAYSPHERGSNENRNRVLRRFIPKGQPIDEITDDELIQINWY